MFNFFSSNHKTSILFKFHTTYCKQLQFTILHHLCYIVRSTENVLTFLLLLTAGFFHFLTIVVLGMFLLSSAIEWMQFQCTFSTNLWSTILNKTTCFDRYLWSYVYTIASNTCVKMTRKSWILHHCPLMNRSRLRFTGLQRVVITFFVARFLNLLTKQKNINSNINTSPQSTAPKGNLY